MPSTSSTPQQIDPIAHIKNDQVEATLERKDHCLIWVDATFSKSWGEKTRKKAIKEVSRATEIPGFRKGKAPESLVVGQYTKIIEKEEKELALREAILFFLRSFQIHLLNDKSVQVKKMEKKETGELHLLLQFECFPTLPEVDLTSFSIEALLPSPVAEIEVQQTIEEIRRYHAIWHEITDRPSQENDFLVINMDIVDEEPPRAIYKNSRFQLTDLGVPRWAKRVLIGLRPGESVEVMSEKEGQDAESQDAEPFKPKKTRFTLLKIQVAEMDEESDALAQKTGAPTMEELRKRVRDSIERNHKEEALSATKRKLQEQLSTLYPFDLPFTPLQHLELRAKEFVEKNGASFKKAEDKIAAERSLITVSKSHLQISYLLPKLAEQLNISIPTHDEVNMEMMRIQLHQMQESGKATSWSEEEKRSKIEEITRELYFDKILDAILEIVSTKKA